MSAYKPLTMHIKKVPFIQGESSWNGVLENLVRAKRTGEGGRDEFFTETGKIWMSRADIGHERILMMIDKLV